MSDGAASAAASASKAAAAELERLLVAQLLGELRAEDARGEMLAALAQRGVAPDSDPRIAALLRLATEHAQALGPLRSVVHRLRNRVAGVLANVEFIETVLVDTAGALEGRRDLLTAIAHARRSCIDLADTLRDVTSPAPR